MVYRHEQLLKIVVHYDEFYNEIETIQALINILLIAVFTNIYISPKNVILIGN